MKKVLLIGIVAAAAAVTVIGGLNMGKWRETATFPAFHAERQQTDAATASARQETQESAGEVTASDRQEEPEKADEGQGKVLKEEKQSGSASETEKTGAAGGTNVLVGETFDGSAGNLADDAAPVSGEKNVTGSGEWASPLDRYFRDEHFWDGCPERNVQLLTPNPYSRPEKPVDEINDIVIHYVDQPGSTAMDNRDYFESLKDGSGRSVSSHFIISTDGEIVQCAPLGEVAYASNDRNHDTISIECCHPDDTGEFTDATYESCIDLTAWLCYAFEIGPEHVIRHYDVTGKDCPIFYVRNPDKWEELKADVARRYEEYEQSLGKRA